jgi:hypothetical protein
MKQLSVKAALEAILRGLGGKAASCSNPDSELGLAKSG